MKRFGNKQKQKLFLAIILMILALGQALFREILPQSTGEEGILEVHCIDAGQGDSTLIIGETQTMLIDASERTYADDVCAYLNEMGIKKIDYLVATHPHSDHIGGMADVMSQFSVGCLVLTDETSDGNAYQNMLYSAEELQIPTLIPEAGDSIPFTDASCQVLGPLSLDTDNSNNNSMILRITFGETVFLLMGDAEREQERDLINSWGDLSADVLKVGHHGSDTSSNDFFLERVMPEYAVISCGLNNRFDHPSPEALRRLKAWCKEIYRTDLDGTVVVRSDGTTIRIQES